MLDRARKVRDSRIGLASNLDEFKAELNKVRATDDGSLVQCVFLISFYRCCVGIDYPSPISCPRTRARTYTPGQPDIGPLVRAQIDGGEGQGGNEGNQTFSGCRSSSISSSGGGLWQWRGLSTAQWGGQGWAYSHT